MPGRHAGIDIGDVAVERGGVDEVRPASAGAEVEVVLAEAFVENAEARRGSPSSRRRRRRRRSRAAAQTGSWPARIRGAVPEHGSQTSPSGESAVIGSPTILPLFRSMAGRLLASYLLRSTLYSVQVPSPPGVPPRTCR